MRDSSVIATQVDLVAEVNRAGAQDVRLEGDECKMVCPFHSDKSPSLSLNTRNGLFRCLAASCAETGDSLKLLARLLTKPRHEVLADLATRYRLELDRTISLDVVEKYHARIWTEGPLLKQLSDRGVTTEDIRKHRLGVDDGRITIPIFSASGLCVNVRRYLPGGPPDRKMLNTRGYGAVRLYPVDQLLKPNVVVCGGELKAVVAARLLDSTIWGAVSSTAGEGNWHDTFTDSLRGKRIWIMMDIDRAGEEASRALIARLRNAVEQLYVVTLPLLKSKYPKGDINDWVGKEGASSKDLQNLLTASPEWRRWEGNRIEVEKPKDTPLDVDLKQISGAGKAQRRLRFAAVAAAVDASPYILPKDVHFSCDMTQVVCPECKMLLVDRDDERACKVTIDVESPSLLACMDSSIDDIDREVARALGVPDKCKSVKLKVLSHYRAESCLLSPKLGLDDDGSAVVTQSAVIIGEGVEPNAPYLMTGATMPSPKDQRSTILVSEAVPAEDSLSSYQPSPETLSALNTFRVAEESSDGVDFKLFKIYADLESNVTRIFCRHDLHRVCDLVFHSPLLLPDGDRVVKGWLEALVLGDSSQGKSETASRLVSHYRSGVIVECKNATVAGLLGGVNEVAKRRWVSWGHIPTQDRRMVVLEELKGASTSVIAALTGMRSTGIAEIPKIERRKTRARTRLLAVSNPRASSPVDSYDFGVKAILELIGSPEDVRRFDVCAVLSRHQVDEGVLTERVRSPDRVSHTYTSNLCHSLIVWAWTRTVEQIKVSKATEAAAMDLSLGLSKDFSDEIPVVDRGSMRFKLLRIAASTAARVFSASDDGLDLIIEPYHVESAERFVRKLYTDRWMGYDEYTRASKLASEVVDSDLVLKHLGGTPFPKDLVEQLLSASAFDLRDLSDWCGWEREDSISLLSLLVRKHCIVRDGRSYRKTPPFISLLKAARGQLAGARPAWVQEKKEKF